MISIMLADENAAPNPDMQAKGMKAPLAQHMHLAEPYLAHAASSSSLPVQKMASVSIAPARRNVPATPARSNQEKARALYDYQPKPTETDELSFKAGDTILIAEKTSEEWWKGRVQGRDAPLGQDRLFPANYVEMIKQASIPAMPPAYSEATATALTTPGVPNEINDHSDFQRILDTAGTRMVAVMFWTDTCGSAANLVPLFTTLAKTYGKDIFVLVNGADDSPGLAILHAHYVRNIPTVLFFKNAQEVDKIIGRNEPKLRSSCLAHTGGLPNGPGAHPATGTRARFSSSSTSQAPTAAVRAGPSGLETETAEMRQARKDKLTNVGSSRLGQAAIGGAAAGAAGSLTRRIF